MKVNTIQALTIKSTMSRLDSADCSLLFGFKEMSLLTVT